MKIIYALIDPTTSQVKYIGQTKNKLSIRYNRHLRNARSQKTPSYLLSWINSLLAKNVYPEIIIIDKVEDSDYWEEFYISYFKFLGAKLTNLAKGGKSRGSFKHTEEHKLKMSVLFKNRKPWNTGLNLSNEHIEKIKSFKGKYRHSEEVKNAMRKAKKIKYIEQYDKMGNFIKEWENTYSVGKELGFNIKAIQNNLAGRCNSACNFVWKFKNGGKIG